MLSQEQFVSEDIEHQKNILLDMFSQIQNQTSEIIDMIDLLKSWFIFQSGVLLEVYIMIENAINNWKEYNAILSKDNINTIHKLLENDSKISNKEADILLENI